MTSQKTLVPRGARRAAPAGTLVVAMGVLLLVAGAVGALSSGLQSRVVVASAAQDSAQVRALLAKVRGVDPTVCHLVGRAFGNRWGPWVGVMMIEPYAAAVDNQLLAWLDGAEIGANLLPSLRMALSDADACVRRTAAQLLGRARTLNLSDELRAELASASPSTREAALIAIGHADQASGLSPARTALRAGDAGVRTAAAWALGVIEQTEAIPALTELARDPEVRVRRAVAWALGSIESPTSIPALAEMLNDAHPSVRIQAAHALGTIGHSDAIPALLRVLESDRDADVRRAAAAALGRIGS